MLKDQIGYLQVTEFDEVTVSQFKSGLASLKMDHFELVSEYKPTGDQPQAIEKAGQRI